MCWVLPGTPPSSQKTTGCSLDLSLSPGLQPRVTISHRGPIQATAGTQGGFCSWAEIQGDIEAGGGEKRPGLIISSILLGRPVGSQKLLEAPPRWGLEPWAAA